MSSSGKRSGPDPIEAMAFWEAAQSRLVPVIGEAGFRVLLARSLSLARSDHAWLPRPAGAADDPFADLRTCFASESQARALEASHALREHFTAVLRALIGEALTQRLLAPTHP
jgi:hypothetical protein